MPDTDNAWLDYLHAKEIPAEFWWYGDFPGKFESAERIDIAPYLMHLPRLAATPTFRTPPYVTAQWDSCDSKRTIKPEKRMPVEAAYKDSGCEIITIGGKATEWKLSWDLGEIASVLSNAEAHIGCDSAFMHMAQLYLEPEQIHIYAEPDGFITHHVQRIRQRGAKFTIV